MKIKRLKGLIVGIVLMLSLLMGTVFATDLLGVLSNDYANTFSEEEAMKKLQIKSFDELINEINILGDDVNVSSLIFHAAALKEKAVNISIEQLQSEILNESNSNITRTILIQISRYLDKPVDNELLKEMLHQDKIDFEIKRNVLLNLHQNNINDMVTLEKIISGDDDRLAFQAMKIMNTSDSEKAVKIADRIIQNYNGIVTDKVRAAIKVKASYLANSSTKTERVEFINFCDNILLKDSRKNGNVVSDTIIFALSDVMSEETISYIVSSDKIDRTAKVFCVDQNYRVLKSMLLENLSERNLDIVIQAMKICPLKEMAEPLQGIGTEQLLQLSSSAGEITKEIGKVLDLVNESGISATDKY